MTAGAAAGRPPAFSLRGGCVEFDGVHVIDHLDLDIAAGSFVALLGANGSGKTTLVRALLGLQPLSHGTVTIHGTPLERFREWSRVTFVPQRLPVATGVPVSVLEVVMSSRVSPATRLRRNRGVERTAALHALDRVDLADRARDRLDTLSGGQQRRVMVARALAEDSDTLVLDEPTAGVDLNNQQRLAATLGGLEGLTVLLVAHGLGAMAHLVTRAIVLQAGQIVHDGPTAPPGWVDIHHHDDAGEPPSLLEG